MNATTARRRQKVRRPDLDRSAVRYMVYRLHDGDGRVLYVGRSCNVAQRIKAHVADAVRGYATDGLKARWMPSVRRVSMVGPFTWDEACRVERDEIEAHQPLGNRMFTEAFGWRKRAT